jgi:hypothetical protein
MIPITSITNIGIKGHQNPLLLHEVKSGYVHELVATINPANATEQTIKWSLVDDGEGGATISLINNMYQFVATRKGRYQIKATVENAKYKQR